MLSEGKGGLTPGLQAHEADLYLHTSRISQHPGASKSSEEGMSRLKAEVGLGGVHSREGWSVSARKWGC